jgi:DNA-binding CsgD family transcriptional regulator
MERLPITQLRALTNVVREISAAGDLDDLRQRLCAAMAGLVPSEMTVHFEIDRRERRLTSIANPRGAVDTSGEAVFARHMHQHPLFKSYRRGDGSAVKISDFLSRAQFRRLPLYDEFFKPLGVEHQIAKGLPGRPGVVTGLALFRRGRDFGERERTVLNLVGPHLNGAYRNARLMTEMREELNLLRRGVDEMDRGLVVIDAAGRVRLMTTRARQWVTEYFGRSPAAGLPDDLQRWIVDDETVLNGEGTPVTLRTPFMIERPGRRLSVRSVLDGNRRLLLLEEQRTSPDTQALERLGLSRRQAEVLNWVTAGKTNAEIGTILGTSDRTVDKHLEHILRRLGVETRTAAAALALSTSR